MSANKAKERILALLDDAEYNHKYGGGEDRDGYLHSGQIDWNVLKKEVVKVLDEEFNTHE